MFKTIRLFAVAAALVLIAGQAATAAPSKGMTAAAAGDRQSAEELVRRGRQAVSLKNYDEALQAFADASKADPDWGDPYIDTGWVYNEMGKAQDAIPYLTKGLELAPNDTRGLGERAYAYGELGDHKAAVADLDRAIRLAPNEPGFYNERCWNKTQLKDYRSALGDCDKAVSLKPDDVDSRRNRFPVNQALGNWQAVVDDCDVILARNPEDKDARAARTDALRLLGR